MKKSILIFVKTVVVFGMFFVAGCGGGDEPKPEVNNGSNGGNSTGIVPDPPGTITTNISRGAIGSSGSGIVIQGTSSFITGSGITWYAPDNIHVYGDNQVSICDLGTMRGLGNITSIPNAGYTAPSYNMMVSCETGHGYVVKFENIQGEIVMENLYVRMYVVEKIISTSGGIIGAKVKYQYPFEITSLSFSKNELTFTGDQEEPQTITITTNASDWTYSIGVAYSIYPTFGHISITPWVNVVKNNNTLSISAPEFYHPDWQGPIGRVCYVIIQANENTKYIRVSQTSVEQPQSLD